MVSSQEFDLIHVNIQTNCGVCEVILCVDSKIRLMT